MPFSWGSVFSRVRLFVIDQRVAIVVGVALFIAVIALTATTHEVYDDPWILYRYADNLASGHGWTFNPGASEANAVTAPLVVLLLAALIKVGFSTYLASAAIFMVGTWVAAQFAFLMFRGIGRPLAGAIAAALVVSSPWLASLRGMESALLLGLTGVVIWAATTERNYVTGLSLGLAVLTRPDAVVLAAFMLLSLGLKRRSLPARETAALACVIVPWLIYSQMAFHSFLPSSLAAKEAQRQSGQWGGLANNFLTTTSLSGHLAGAAMGAAVALAGYLVMAFTKPWPLLPLFGASATSFIVYEFILKIAGYPWYAASILYTSFLLMGLGLDFIARRSLTLRVGALALTAVLVTLGVLNPYQMSAERRDDATVAQWLRANAKPDARVASAEIGQLGYVSGLRMVDYLGLLDPRANSHVRTQDWSWWMDTYCPDYWTTSGTIKHWVVENAVLTSDSFRREYRLVYRTANLEVYRRTAACRHSQQPIA